MPDLFTHQSAIFASHFEGDVKATEKLIIPDGLSVTQRLAIYKNNTFITLTEALSKTYPVIQKLVGSDFFDYAAREFIQKSPPLPGPLSEYGSGFADFLDGFEAAKSIPYLGDVARLEWAMNVSYHAENIPPINAQDLSQIPEDIFGSACLILHPSYQTATSEYPVFDIWQYNQPDGETVEINFNTGSNILIIRPDERVNIHSVNIEFIKFLRLLESGKNIEQACALTEAIAPEFDCVRAVVELLSIGIFSEFQLNDRIIPQNKYHNEGNNHADNN